MNDDDRAAWQRVEEIYAAIDRLGREALWTPFPDRDLEDRVIRLARLERAVDRRGRASLLDESRRWLREALDQRVVSRGRGPETGVWAISDVGRAEDIAAVRLALDDAVSVAVAFDLIDRDDAIVLATPGFALLGLPHIGEAPAASEPAPIDQPAPSASDRPAWEPSADDWAASADGAVSSVKWRWWTAPQEASQGRLLGVVLITIVGAVAGATFFGLIGVLVIGTLAGGVGWLLVGIPRQPTEDELADEPEDEPS